MSIVSELLLAIFKPTAEGIGHDISTGDGIAGNLDEIELTLSERLTLLTWNWPTYLPETLAKAQTETRLGLKTVFARLAKLDAVEVRGLFLDGSIYAVGKDDKFEELASAGLVIIKPFRITLLLSTPLIFLAVLSPWLAIGLGVLKSDLSGLFVILFFSSLGMLALIGKFVPYRVVMTRLGQKLAVEEVFPRVLQIATNQDNQDETSE